MKLNAKQLRKGLQTTDYKLLQEAKDGRRKPVDGRQNEIYIILDNVLDTYNIGSIFRLADAIGVKKVYLCGDTATPPNPRIKKASINTTEWMEWSYKESAMEAIKELRIKNKELSVIAVEQSEQSVPYDKLDYTLPLALVVGHETYGVSKETLAAVDGIVELPMFGVNISLNVMVSLAIVLYKALEGITPHSAPRP